MKFANNHHDYLIKGILLSNAFDLGYLLNIAFYQSIYGVQN